MIKFNNISSGTLGCYVEHYPPRPVPQRKVEVYSVPGRSGDVIDEQDAWENVEQVYDVYLSAEQAGLPAVAAAVVRWLSEPRGYARLEDDYDPDVFRMAAFTDGADLKNTLNAFGRGRVKFNCRPQRFLKAGETPIVPGNVTESGAVVTFESDTAGASISDLSAEFHPTQTYNGYSKPWAGGTGKNLLKTGGLTYSAPSNTAYSNATKRTFTAGTWFDGLTSTNYYNPRATDISVAENAISFVTPASAYGVNIPVVGLSVGETYTISANVTNGRIGLIFYEQDGSFISGGNSTSTVPEKYTATVPANAYYAVAYFAGSTINEVSSFSNIQIEQRDTPSSYVPYENACPITGHTGLTISQSGADTTNPTNTAIDWSATAGTLFGGTLDVTSGALTASYGNIASYAGEALPGAWLSSLDEYTPGGTPTTGAQVVYELASPVSYTITGVAFTTLLGENNFWADTGDVSVTYPAGGASLVNPTGYPAEPLITVYGAGSGSVTIGSVTVTISSITDGMVLDCAEGEAYAESGGVVTNLNSVVSGGFPVLGAGESSVSYAGGVTAVEIIPRWWEL